MNNLRWQPHWLPRLSHFRDSHVTDGEPATAVSASLQKIKSIKNQHNKNSFHFFIFYFTKSQNCDSYVNHFDGHFAYLKTLDFSFNSAGQDGFSVEFYQFVFVGRLICSSDYSENSIFCNSQFLFLTFTSNANKTFCWTASLYAKITNVALII